MYKTTQRQLRQLINSGAAIELTTLDDVKAVPNRGLLRKIAYSAGVHGINGGLLCDTTSGRLYAIPRDTGILVDFF